MSEQEPREDGEAGTERKPASSVAPKSKPDKFLPTTRVALEKQIGILRSVAIVSSQDAGPVSLEKAARVVDLKPSSISLCAPFFVESRLWMRADAGGFTPAQAVLDYERACQWNPENAGAKLAPVLKETWFARSIQPVLALQPKSREECVQVLAEACGASVHYREQLDLLVDYLALAQLVDVDGTTVRRRVAIPGSIKEPPKERTEADQSSEDEEPRKPPLESGLDAGIQIRLSVPHKDDAVIHLPEDFEADDYEMLRVQLDAYMRRGFGWKPPPT